MVSFNTGNTDNLDHSQWPAPGIYHVTLQDAVELEDSVKLTFSVLTGTVDGQAGKTMTHRFFLPDSGDEKKDANNVKRLLRAAVALGMISPEQVQKGVNVNLDFATALGASCVIKVNERTYEKDGEKKKATEIGDFGFGIYRVTDKEVAAVPKDPRWMGVVAGPAAGGGGGSPQPVAAGAGSSAANDFSDI